MSNHIHPVINELNPYKNCTPGDPTVIRVSNDFRRADVLRIRSVCIDYGFLNTCISRFVKHLYEHCERHNLSYSDRNTIIEYVISITHLSTDLAGPAPSGPEHRLGPSDTNVGGRPKEMGADDPRTSDVKRSSKRKQATKKNG